MALACSQMGGTCASTFRMTILGQFQSVISSSRFHTFLDRMPLITLKEKEMVEFMNQVTDDPGWELTVGILVNGSNPTL